MDRYARRQHFERLCGMRDRYASLGPDDTVWIITVADVIEWASEQLATESVPSANDESPRQKTIIGETFFARLRGVELMNVLRLLPEIHGVSR